MTNQDTSKNEDMASLLDNLSIAWTGDFDSLREFMSDELNLIGNWEQPRGDKKIFKSETISVSWRKGKSVLNIEGVDAGRITYLLCTKLCKELNSTNPIPSIKYSNNSSQTDLIVSQSCSCKCIDVYTSIQQLESGQDVNCEAIRAISDSITHITEAMTQIREDIDKNWERNRVENLSSSIQEVIHNQISNEINDASEININENRNTNEINEANSKETNEANTIEINEVNNPNTPDINVSNSSHQKNANTNNQQKNTTPKHLVPCPFLLRKGHCLKGISCDFSHDIGPLYHYKYQRQDRSFPFHNRSYHPHQTFPFGMKYPIPYPHMIYPYMYPLMKTPPMPSISRQHHYNAYPRYRPSYAGTLV